MLHRQRIVRHYRRDGSPKGNGPGLPVQVFIKHEFRHMNEMRMLHQELPCQVALVADRDRTVCSRLK